MATTTVDSDRLVFVPITPCRLVDTRSKVGLNDPLGPGAQETIHVVGSNGNCEIPDTARAVALNLTALDPSEQTWLTVWPEGPLPVASNLNPIPGQSPVANAVATGLAGDGTFQIFNQRGTVGLVVDVSGYYVQRRPEGVLWVAKSGGDFTLPSEALTAIGTTLPDSSASNPYLIKLAPGDYREDSPLVMKDFVDLEGSGTDITTVRSVFRGDVFDASSATVSMTDLTACELRQLTIVNEGDGPISTGVWIKNGDERVAIRNATIKVVGSGILHGVYANGERPVMIDVLVITEGGTNVTAVHNVGANTHMTTVFITIDNAGGGYGIRNYSSAPWVSNGGILVRHAKGEAVGMLNEINSTPLVRGEAIWLVDGPTHYGVRNTGGSIPEMENVSINVEATETAIGMENDSSTAVMSDVSIGLQGSGTITAVSNTSSSPGIDDLIVFAGAPDDGAVKTGVLNADDSKPTIRDSKILMIGDADAIRNQDTSLTYLANTLLLGDVEGPPGSFPREYGNRRPDFTPIVFP